MRLVCAATIALALHLRRRRRVRSAGEIMASMVADRVVEHLERAGFVVMKRPPTDGGAALARGFERR